MNSYFFFGFHIFKDFNVTEVFRFYPKRSLNNITKLALKSYLSKSDRVLKFLQEYVFKVIYKKIFNNQSLLLLFNFWKVEFIA